MSSPKVSVCIPVYNGEKHLEKAIKSVLNQSFKDFELVIVDNASTDKTQEVINGFTDHRIKRFRNEKNLGMVGNWNRCLDHSNGEFIQFIFHDDYITENCLEKKVMAFNIDKDIGLVFSATYIVNDNETIVIKRRELHSDKLFDGKKIAYQSFVRKNIYGEPSNVMFKKELSNKVGYFDERLCYAIDWDYWIKLSMLGKVYYVSEFLTYFRISDTSATSNLMKQKEKLALDDHQLIENCLNNQELKLNGIDILFHKINRVLRMYAREIVYKWNNRR
jgi:glycosyltransferase involved in cell wall biosynthesis